MFKTELLVSAPKEWPHKYLEANLFGQNLHLKVNFSHCL